MTHLMDIFLQPSKVFADLKVRPTFVTPLLLTALLGAAMILLYSMKVDPTWYVDHTLAAGGEMSASELAQAKKVLPGARTMGYFGAAMALIGTVLAAALYALYFMLAGKITGAATSFKHGLSLSSWAGMPVLLGTVVALIGVFTMTPLTGLEALMLTNVDPLLVQLPADHRWSAIAKSFSLLNLWAMFLIALGWRVWGRTSWTQAIVVAALPSVVIFGAMALWALSR
ncbi:MAG: YIP1 family protein [Lysobacter sp.]